MRRPTLSDFVAALVVVCTHWASILAAADMPRPLFIEGYAGRQSYSAGQEAELHVSTSAARFSVEVHRVGASNELVWSKRDVPGAEHVIPDNASAFGCRWPVALRVPVSASWRSGYYVATLRAEDFGEFFTHRGRRTAEGEAHFVVRAAEPGRASKVLLQIAANTYNAYNNWGGFSLYGHNSRGGNQGSRVSFHRPGGSQFTTWEQPFAAWAERNGYALEYAVNNDLDQVPRLLEAYKLVVSVGHDEYWSTPMRDALEGFIGRGGNVAFFSGNAVCWQVRSEDNGHALVCWKQNYFQDPVFRSEDHRALTTLWSHHLVKRPENGLTGVGFLWGGYRKCRGPYVTGETDYTVHRPDHWVFHGTGLKPGDAFGGSDSVFGHETDGCELEWKDNLPFPTHRDGTPTNFTVLSTCPVRWHPDDVEWYERWERGRQGHAVMGVYTRGGTVFTAGTTDWAHGLQRKDPVVMQVTRNVLDRLGK